VTSATAHVCAWGVALLCALIAATDPVKLVSAWIARRRAARDAQAPGDAGHTREQSGGAAAAVSTTPAAAPLAAFFGFEVVKDGHLEGRAAFEAAVGHAWRHARHAPRAEA
jgi:hypothetical protein